MITDIEDYFAKRCGRRTEGHRADRGQSLRHHRQEAGQPSHDLQHPCRRIRARAGLDDVRIHDLRHSYASGALALGEGLPMIGKLLGHTQVQTTARYAHLAEDPVKAAAGKESDAIGAAALGTKPKCGPARRTSEDRRRRQRRSAGDTVMAPAAE